MGGENLSRPSKTLITDDERDLVEMLLPAENFTKI